MERVLVDQYPDRFGIPRIEVVIFVVGEEDIVSSLELWRSLILDRNFSRVMVGLRLSAIGGNKTVKA